MSVETPSVPLQDWEVYFFFIALSFIFSMWFQVRAKTESDREVAIGILICGLIPGLQMLTVLATVLWIAWQILTFPSRFSQYHKDQQEAKKKRES